MILKAARIHQELDRSARLAGDFYSMALNSWGVALQQAGLLKEAAAQFEEARRLGPENVPALINLECNRALQASQTLVLDPLHRVEDDLGRSRDWDASLRRDGPADSPDACYCLGLECAKFELTRQAIQHFERAKSLAPGSMDASLRLAELFLEVGDNTNSLVEAERVFQVSPRQPRALLLQGLAFVQMRKFYQAIPPLNELLTREANNIDARLARAVALLNLDKLQAAREDYEQVLQASPTTYPAYYGLADIAYQTKNTPALLANCQLYLSNAPPNAPEIGQINEWLNEIKPPPANR